MKREQIALYLRVSKADDSRWESSSISMQRSLLLQYVKANFTEYDLQEFCDDGYTGTNFQRPAMQRMLESVRQGKLTCIIVKDFSRFARDYIEQGMYLERMFPLLGVRFISINDHYDSKNYAGGIADMDVMFRTLVYDLYSKDLSQKVRTALLVRKEQGKYVSANSPFGYEKDPKDRHMLRVAEDEAEVVRKIFVLALDGYRPVEIAAYLKEHHIKTPIEFRIEKGQTNRQKKEIKFSWNRNMVCRILHNEVYIGNIVQGKYEKEFVGGKTRRKPRKEWIIQTNHHEPIIEQTVFDSVQTRNKKVK